MNIRCLKCKAANPYDIGREATRAISCKACGARLFPVYREEGERYQRDLERAGAELADKSRIDLASANSVLLGLMSLSQAQALQDEMRAGIGARHRANSRSDSPQPLPPPGTAASVDRGEQTLQAAKYEEKFARGSQHQEKKPISTRTAAFVAAIAILAAVAIGTHGWRRWQEHNASIEPGAREPKRDAQPQQKVVTESKPPPATTPAQVQRDLDGRPTRISAPTPEGVLVAYCRELSTISEPCEPIEIASTRPERNGARLGLLRLFSNSTEDYAITILENRDTGWWNAGSGESALQPYVVVPQHIGDRRRPVSEHKSSETISPESSALDREAFAMKNWKTKLVLAALATAFVAAPVFDTPWSTAAVASGPDRDPPVVIVQPSEILDAGAPVTIGAQIIDPSGIGRVVLWVRGEQEDEFREVSMEQIGENQVQAELAPWPERGSYVAFYIEARDAKGNGPGYAGAPRTPYVIRIKGAAPGTAEAKINWVLWGVAAVGLIVVAGGYLLTRRAMQERAHAELTAELNRLTGMSPEPKSAAKAPAAKPERARPRSHVPADPAEQAFWIGLLTPLRDMGTYDREHALKNIAVRPHHHPTLGKRFFDVGTLTRHFEWVQSGEIQVKPEMVVGQPHPKPTAESAPPKPS